MLKNRSIRRIQSERRPGRRTVLVALAAGGCLAALAQADIITVKNTGNDKVTLSDLIVYDAEGKEEVILKPNDASDDVELGSDDSRVFVTKFKAAKYYVSVTVGKSEHEWLKTVEVKVPEPKAVSYYINPAREQPVHCAVVEPIGALIPPPPGAEFFVEEGFVAEWPGLFFGRTPDFATGEILDPYTGPAAALDAQLSIDVEEGPCYPDCDASGSMDFFDFLCFQNAFAAGERYADCDQSGSLDFFDFLCFQDQFAAGCVIQTCLPDVRTTIAGAETDPPELQQRYDAINRSLHLYGSLPIRAAFGQPIDALLPDLLKALDSMEACTGLPTDVRAIERALFLLADAARGRPVGELLSLPPEPEPDLVEALALLQELGIGFPELAQTDEEAKLRADVLPTVLDAAGGIRVADLLLSSNLDAPAGAFEAVRLGKSAALFYIPLILSNDRCCAKGQGTPIGTPPFQTKRDKCKSDTWSYCGVPNQLNCSWLSDHCE
jgi:hypothetical protein